MFFLNKIWYEGFFYGVWKFSGRVGGCINYKIIFVSNLQVYILGFFILNSDQVDFFQLIVIFFGVDIVKMFLECFIVVEFENVKFIFLNLNVNFNFSLYLILQKVKMI